MAIRIHKGIQIGGGCSVKIGQVTDDVVRYFRDACSQQGWQVADRGEVPGVAHSRSFDIKGPTPDEFRAALEGDKEFDFSRFSIGG